MTTALVGQIIGVLFVLTWSWLFVEWWRLHVELCRAEDEEVEETR